MSQGDGVLGQVPLTVVQRRGRPPEEVVDQGEETAGLGGGPEEGGPPEVVVVGHGQTTTPWSDSGTTSPTGRPDEGCIPPVSGPPPETLHDRTNGRRGSSK